MQAGAWVPQGNLGLGRICQAWSTGSCRSWRDLGFARNFWSGQGSPGSFFPGRGKCLPISLMYPFWWLRDLSSCTGSLGCVGRCGPAFHITNEGFQVGAWWRALLDPPRALSGVELDFLPVLGNCGALAPSPPGLPGTGQGKSWAWSEIGRAPSVLRPPEGCSRCLWEELVPEPPSPWQL